MKNQKEMDYFAALYNVARVVNASLDTAKILEEIVRVVTTTMKVKASILRILDSRKQRLLLGAAYGLSETYIRKGPVLLKESGLDQKAIAGEIIWIKDARTDRDFQYKDMARAEGIESVLVLPLKIGRKVIGVLRVYSDVIREFNRKEIKFLEAVANLSAIALDNARLYQALKTDYDLLAAAKYRIDDN
ncbi:MAG: GAF domain-containing protein [Syntrophales bacterium]